MSWAASDLTLGTYPTALELLAPLSRGGSALWVKRDDQIERRLRR